MNFPSASNLSTKLVNTSLVAIVVSPLNIFSMYVSTTFLSSPDTNADNSLASPSTLLLSCVTARYIPYPYSALSSNSEFAQDGPLPSWFTVYGVDGAEAPQIDEQPVAFATIILGPNNCVTSFMYAVSPQPAQAPENSRSGCLN